jgi:butyrate kinase
LGCINRTFSVLVVNTGSTSTKVAVYSGCKPVYSDNIQHPPDELAQYARISDQLEYRKNVVLGSLEANSVMLDEVDAVISRGGALKPVPGGVYSVDDVVVDDLLNRPSTEHAANLAAPIARALADSIGVCAYFADPITVDEYGPLARLSGLPDISRLSKLHALSIRSTAAKAAESLGKAVEDVDLVVAHLGSGISICPVKAGKMIDANGADDEGPLSPERSGSLPMSDLVTLCYSGKYTEDELLHLITHGSGLLAHLGTTDAREVEKRILAGDEHAEKVEEVMAYQISKEIGAMATVLCGRVDAIALTGGLASWERLVGHITERCSFIAPIVTFPGENEMEALARSAMRVLAGEEEARSYASV